MKFNYRRPVPSASAADHEVLDYVAAHDLWAADRAEEGNLSAVTTAEGAVGHAEAVARAASIHLAAEAEAEAAPVEKIWRALARTAVEALLLVALLSFLVVAVRVLT